jgi:hypothetical protein
MSEERRKRQQERDDTPPLIPRKYFRWGGVLALFVIAYVAGWYYNNHKYDRFAKCLAEKHAKMYGLYWCPHCLDQKHKFGASFRYVPYVECALSRSQEAPECKAAGIQHFPSWQFGAEPPKEGVLSLQALSDKTGCSLP